MAINLSKGGNINLSKTAPTMNKVDLGLGWNPRATDGKAFDLDAVAFLTGEDGKVRLDGEFIRPLAKVVIASSSGLPVQRLS